MKKLLFLFFLSLLLLTGCATQTNEYEIGDKIENFVPLSEQTTQKQEKEDTDFEKKIMCSNMYENLQNYLNGIYTEPNYSKPGIIKEVFYSPTEDTCAGVVEVYYKKYLDTEPKYMTYVVYNILDYTSQFFHVCFDGCENEPYSDAYDRYNAFVNYLKGK